MYLRQMHFITGMSKEKREGATKSLARLDLILNEGVAISHRGRQQRIKLTWMSLPNRELLWFRRVLALPKASRIGLVCKCADKSFRLDVTKSGDEKDVGINRTVKNFLVASLRSEAPATFQYIIWHA